MKNADECFKNALKAGVTGPFGNQWWIATRMEDLSEEEIIKDATKHSGT